MENNSHTEYVKARLLQIANGDAREMERNLSENNVELDMDENQNYVFRFGDGKIIVGDIGGNGQGVVIHAYERNEVCHV